LIQLGTGQRHCHKYLGVQMAVKQFNESMLDDFALVLDNLDKLDAIIEFPQCVGVGLDGLGRRIAEKKSLDQSLVSELLLTISRLKRFFGLRESSEEAIDWVSKNLEARAPSEWREQYEDKLKASAKTIAELTDKIGDDHPMMIALKAQALVYSHQNIFLDAKLITDIRPVFNNEASKVDELVVTHMLTIDYTDGTQHNTVLTVAMDQDDIAILQGQCERAIKKTITLKKELKDFQLVVMPDNSGGAQ